MASSFRSASSLSAAARHSSSEPPSLRGMWTDDLAPFLCECRLQRLRATFGRPRSEYVRRHPDSKFRPRRIESMEIKAVHSLSLLKQASPGVERHPSVIFVAPLVRLSEQLAQKKESHPPCSSVRRTRAKRKQEKRLPPPPLPASGDCLPVSFAIPGESGISVQIPSNAKMPSS